MAWGVDWGAEYLGIAFVVVGVILDLRIRKRIFDRTNQFGVERFSGYINKLVTKARDGLSGGIAYTLIGAGLLILALRFEDSWGWIVLLPVSAGILFLLLLSW